MGDNQGIQIRNAMPSDTCQILDIYAPFIRDTSHSFETEVPDTMEFLQRIQAIQVKLPWMVCEKDSEILGYAYACDHRSRAAYECSKEISVYIKEGYRRCGIAKALYTVIFHIIKMRGYTSVLAGIVLPNDPSIRFHEKMGFNKIGIFRHVGFKFGSFHSTCWYQKILGDINRPFQVNQEDFPEEIQKIIEKAIQLVEVTEHR